MLDVPNILTVETWKNKKISFQYKITISENPVIKAVIKTSKSSK